MHEPAFQALLDRGNVKTALRTAQQMLSRLERETVVWSDRRRDEIAKLRFDIALLEDGVNDIDFPGALRVAQPYIEADRLAWEGVMAEAIGEDADRIDASLPN